MMPNDLQPPKYERHTDPKGNAAKVAAKVAPWVSLIAAASLLCNLILAAVVWMGGRMISPKEELQQISRRVEALEAEDSRSRMQRDRTEVWALALIRSKCLELDPNSQAVSVLPCENARDMLQWRAPNLADSVDVRGRRQNNSGHYRNPMTGSDMVIFSYVPANHLIWRTY